MRTPSNGTTGNRFQQICSATILLISFSLSACVTPEKTNNSPSAKPEITPFVFFDSGAIDVQFDTANNLANFSINEEKYTDVSTANFTTKLVKHAGVRLELKCESDAIFDSKESRAFRCMVVQAAAKPMRMAMSNEDLDKLAKLKRRASRKCEKKSKNI